MPQISLLSKDIEICQFEGQVVDVNKHLETKVSGSGGGGAMYNGSGAVAPVSISSQTTVHDNFFLVDKDGNERSIRLSNWDVSMRTGHLIQVVWAIPPKQEKGPYVLVQNKNLGEVHWADKQLKNVVSPILIPHLLIGVGIAIILGYLFGSFSFFLIIVVASFIYYTFRTQALAKQLKEQISHLYLK